MQPGDRLAGTHPLTGLHEHGHEEAGEEAGDRLGPAGAVDEPDDGARLDQLALGGDHARRVGTEDAGGRRDHEPLGEVHAVAVGQGDRGGHETTSRGRSAGVWTRPDLGIGGDPTDEAGERGARTDLDERGGAELDERGHAVRPADRFGEMGAEHVRPAGAVGVGSGVVVGDDRVLARRERGGVEGRAELLGGRRHERGVERPSDLEGPHPADAGVGRRLGRPFDAIGGAGDHDLAGRVEVRQPAGVGGGVARRLGLLFGGAEEGGHPTRVGVVGGLGGVGAGHGEPEAGVTLDGTGGDQRGDLTERVAGEPDDVARERRRDGVPGDQRGGEHRELGFAGAAQLLGGRVDEEVREVDVGRRACGADRRPGRVVDPGQAGARLLAALAGEHDGNAQLRLHLGGGTGGRPVAGDLRLRHLRITDGFTYCRVTSPFSSERHSTRPSRGHEMRE